MWPLFRFIAEAEMLQTNQKQTNNMYSPLMQKTQNTL